MKRPGHPARRLLKNLFALVEGAGGPPPNEHPTDDELTLLLGRNIAPPAEDAIYAHLADCGECRDVLGGLLVLDRKRHRGLARGRVALRNGRWKQAETQFSRVTELFPEEYLAWFGRGRACTGRQDFVAAETAYRRCLQLNQSSVGALVNLAHTLDELGRSAEAFELWRKLLAERDRIQLDRSSQLKPDLRETE